LHLWSGRFFFAGKVISVFYSVASLFRILIFLQAAAQILQILQHFLINQNDSLK